MKGVEEIFVSEIDILIEQNNALQGNYQNLKGEKNDKDEKDFKYCIGNDACWNVDGRMRKPNPNEL